MSGSGAILVSRCTSCHGRFLPRAGPCPRCGAGSTEPYPLPAKGIVLAATELLVPIAPWPSPHRLVLVELQESVRVLATAAAPVSIGDHVRIRRDEDRYSVET